MRAFFFGYFTDPEIVPVAEELELDALLTSSLEEPSFTHELVISSKAIIPGTKNNFIFFSLFYTFITLQHRYLYLTQSRDLLHPR